MKFAMEVEGHKEKHLLEYEFNALMGSIVIKVNNQEVKRFTRWISTPKKESHHLILGQREPLNVRIEKEYRFPFGHRNRVFVNDRLVKCFEG